MVASTTGKTSGRTRISKGKISAISIRTVYMIHKEKREEYNTVNSKKAYSLMVLNFLKSFTSFGIQRL